MPGRLFLTTPLEDVAQCLNRRTDHTQPPRRNIAPGQDVVTITKDSIALMRWGMIMTGRKNARGRPVMETIVNARSETVFDKSAFVGVGRAVVPADGWYEWTGKKGRKTAWSITSKSGDLLWFAAIFDVWNAPGGLDVPQVATITCPPNGDVRDIHDRMGVLLMPDQVDDWLSGHDVPMEPAPDGSLSAKIAEDVDWDGP